jgi:hypothetical protein
MLTLFRSPPAPLTSSFLDCRTLSDPNLIRRCPSTPRARQQANVDPAKPNLFSEGKLLWQRSDKMCEKFRTCGATGDQPKGTAKVRACPMNGGLKLCAVPTSPPPLAPYER